MARTRRHVRKNRGSRKSKSVNKHHRRPRKHGRKTRKGGSFLSARDDAKEAKRLFGHAGTLVTHGAKKLGSSVKHGFSSIRRAL